MSNSIKNITLYNQKGSSDKVYTLQIDKVEDGYMVIYANGKRGAALKPKNKTTSPVTLEEATKIYDKLVKEKTSAKKGYTESLDGGDTLEVNEDSGKNSGFEPQLLNEIDKAMALKLCEDDNWVAQEKHDGERRPLIVKDKKAAGTNRYGEFTGGLKSTVANGIDVGTDFIADTEDLGVVLMAFDLLEYDGKDLRNLGFLKRMEVLEDMASIHDSIKVSQVYKTTAEKKALLQRMIDLDREGIVFKKKDAVYKAGKPSKGGDHLKYKLYDEASVLVSKVNDKRSVQMEVITDSGEHVFVGNVTIPANKDIPQVGDVIEVRYLYAYKGGSLYQPIFEKPRPDQRVEECRQSQLKYKAVIDHS